MEPCTSLRWLRMVARALLETMLVLSMALAIVMLSVRMTSSSSTVKLTQRDGSPTQTTLVATWELDTMVHAALRWTSGRRTAWQPHTRRTLVTSRVHIAVKVPIVATMMQGSAMTVCATRMAVTLTLSEWAIQASMAVGRSFQ